MQKSPLTPSPHPTAPRTGRARKSAFVFFSLTEGVRNVTGPVGIRPGYRGREQQEHNVSSGGHGGGRAPRGRAPAGTHSNCH